MIRMMSILLPVILLMVSCSREKEVTENGPEKYEMVLCRVGDTDSATRSQLPAKSKFVTDTLIQVNNFKGDVVEINLDTMLWEFSGDYLSNDVPSGHLIRFPNSMVFQDQVYNYS